MIRSTDVFASCLYIESSTILYLCTTNAFTAFYRCSFIVPFVVTNRTLSIYSSFVVSIKLPSVVRATTEVSYCFVTVSTHVLVKLKY